MVLEDASTGFCGAVTRWANGPGGAGGPRRQAAQLSDRPRAAAGGPAGAGQARPRPPPRASAPRAGPPPARSPARHARAKVALPSRIYVEGRHDAELVEKIWGDDLRHVGVVVEFMDGIDDLVRHGGRVPAGEGPPARGARRSPGPGSKESRIASRRGQGPYGSYVLVAGHPFVDVWQAVKTDRVGLDSPGPHVPRGVTDIKHGTCAALGWPHRDQADIARAWQRILATVTRLTDLERGLLDAGRAADRLRHRRGRLNPATESLHGAVPGGGGGVRPLGNRVGGQHQPAPRSPGRATARRNRSRSLPPAVPFSGGRNDPPPRNPEPGPVPAGAMTVEDEPTGRLPPT